MLKKILDDLNFDFDQLFYDRVDKFSSLLQQWGKVHSLTTKLSKNEIEENIVDSIYPLKFIDDFDTLADIGTGAGYPGLILAIAKPKAKVTLIEPRAKRVAFLNFVKNSLKLSNLTIIQNRVENIEDDLKYDIITSRAVTDTNLLLNITKNIKDDSTSYLFYKGSLYEDELKNINNYQVVNYGKHRNYVYIKGNV